MGIRNIDVALLAAVAALTTLPAQARFLQTDPIGGKDDLDLYVYVKDDPVNATDPKGTDAYVQKDKVDPNKITVTIPVKYTGAADSPKAESSFKNAVENKLSGQFGKYDVTTKVEPAKAGDPHTNTVSFDNKGPNTPSTVTGGNTMSLNVQSNGIHENERQHEAGHLTGMADHYKDNGLTGAARATVPDSGFKGNLMGQLPGNLSESNFNEVMASPNNVVK